MLVMRKEVAADPSPISIQGTALFTQLCEVCVGQAGGIRVQFLSMFLKKETSLIS